MVCGDGEVDWCCCFCCCCWQVDDDDDDAFNDDGQQHMDRLVRPTSILDTEHTNEDKMR